MFAEFKLYLNRRQCALSHLYDLVQSNVDHLVIEIPIETNGRELPLEFFICKKKDLKAKLKEMAYLNEMVHNSNTKHYKPDVSLKTAYMVMSEHDEIAQ